MKKRISRDRRRHQDYLRRKALGAARYYDGRLCRLRASRVRDILRQCRDFDPADWEQYVSVHLTEPYLPEWYRQLYMATGLPQIKSTVRDMNKAKAEDSGVWESVMSQYASQRAGEAVVSVTDTFKRSLIAVLRKELEEDADAGIERMVQKIYRQYRALQEWEVRRIVQTEALISTGLAGDAAARSLDVGFTKQWCTSGLVNTRDTHLAVDGTVVDQDEPFLVGDSMLMYPHDTSMGASASEIINCACSCIRMPR